MQGPHDWHHFERPPPEHYRPDARPERSGDPQYPYLDVYPNIYHPYDPITGEYIKPLQASRPLPSFPAHNRCKTSAQTIVSSTDLIYNDQQSDEQLLCSDCCRTGIPVNCLTLSLMTNLILIGLFSVIKYRFIDPKVRSTPANISTSDVIEEIIFILLFCAIILLIAIFIRYSCNKKHRRVFRLFLQCRCSEIGSQENEMIGANDYMDCAGRDRSVTACNEQFV